MWMGLRAGLTCKRPGPQGTPWGKRLRIFKKVLFMQKDFDQWNKHKKNLDGLKKDLLFKQGEVWWCAVGANIAEESCGKGEFFGRPVLVLKKLSGRNFIGIPLSTKSKIGTWFTDVRVQGQVV